VITIQYRFPIINYNIEVEVTFEIERKENLKLTNTDVAAAKH